MFIYVYACLEDNSPCFVTQSISMVCPVHVMWELLKHKILHLAVSAQQILQCHFIRSIKPLLRFFAPLSTRLSQTLKFPMKVKGRKQISHFHKNSKNLQKIQQYQNKENAIEGARVMDHYIIYQMFNKEHQQHATQSEYKEQKALLSCFLDVLSPYSRVLGSGGPSNYLYFPSCCCCCRISTGITNYSLHSRGIHA